MESVQEALWTTLIPVLKPVHYNPLFTPSVIDKAFLTWKDLGIVSIKHLYISGIFASFNQLTQAFSLQPTHFRYLQVRNFVCRWFPGFPALPPSTLTDTILRVKPNLKRSILLLYNTSLNNLRCFTQCVVHFLFS